MAIPVIVVHTQLVTEGSLHYIVEQISHWLQAGHIFRYRDAAFEYLT